MEAKATSEKSGPTGRIGEKPSQPGEPAIFTMMTGLIKSQGGLAGIIEKLRAAGLTEQVDSWIGKGKNLPVDPEQLMRALGDQAIRASNASGKPAVEFQRLIAVYLPQVIDKLTPDGSVPKSETTLSSLFKSAMDVFRKAG